MSEQPTIPAKEETVQVTAQEKPEKKLGVLGNQPQELTTLMEGNKRYLSGQPKPKDFRQMRQQTADGQKPYAIVLTCSDSRLSPEIIFDAGIGEIFVIRNAGNLANDKTVLGSLEYAAEHLHVPLLLVLGHEKCGAINSAWNATGAESGNIGSLLGKFAGPVGKMKKRGKGPEDAVSENVREQMKKVVQKSEICAKLVLEGKLRVVGAKYSLSGGHVDIVL